MSKYELTFRRTKGSPVTSDEIDQNFRNIKWGHDDHDDTISSMLSNVTQLSSNEGDTTKYFEKIVLQLAENISQTNARNKILEDEIANLKNRLIELAEVTDKASSSFVESVIENDNTVYVGEKNIIGDIQTETVTDDQGNVVEENTYSENNRYSDVIETVEQVIAEKEDLGSGSPLTNIDYSEEIDFFNSEIERIRAKINDWYRSKGKPVYGIILTDSKYMTQEEIYTNRKAEYENLKQQEYKLDNNIWPFADKVVIDTYPYRYASSTQANNLAENETTPSWPISFVGISASSTKLTDYIGLKKANVRISPTLPSVYRNTIPVGILFSQQYSKYMYGMWDSSSILSQRVEREISAYNAVAQLPFWNEVKKYIVASNIYGLCSWMVPGTGSPAGTPAEDRIRQYPYAPDVTNEQFNILIEWINSKIDMLNLTTRLPDFNTPFTMDMIGHSTYENGFASAAWNNANIESDNQPEEYTADRQNEISFTNYFILFFQAYCKTSIGSIYNYMNSHIMDGTVYSNGWNTNITSDKLTGFPIWNGNEYNIREGAATILG